MRKVLALLVLSALYLSQVIPLVSAAARFRTELLEPRAPMSPAAPPQCSPATFTFSGNSSTTGTAGNVRTFTAR